MFRIGLKFSTHGANRVQQYGHSRLYSTIRNYETLTRIKFEQDSRISSNVKLMSRFSGPKYSTESPTSEKSRRSGGLITVGALTLSALGLLAYAKQDPEFRATLEQWVPGTNRAIEIIFLEQNTYIQALIDFFESIKQTLLGLVSREEPKKANEPAKIDPLRVPAAPRPVFVPPVEKKQPPVKEPPTEIRTNSKPAETIKVVPPTPAPPPPFEFEEPPKTVSITELESEIQKSTSQAVAAYKNATLAIEDFNKEVLKTIEGTNAGKAVDHDWNWLLKASMKRMQAVMDAREHELNAIRSSAMAEKLNLGERATPESASKLQQKIRTILEEIKPAKEECESKLKNSNVSERYWQQVVTARQQFAEQLKILLPDVDVAEKKLPIDTESFNLFVLHVNQKVKYLRDELEKLQTINDVKIRTALNTVDDEHHRAKIEALVANELSRAKLALQEEFAKQNLAESKKSKEELRNQLKLQWQIYSDHLRDALKQKELETERIVNRTLTERTETESNKFKLQQAQLVGRIQGLDTALKARMEEDKSASNAQLLWGACQALARAVKVTPPGVSLEEAVRPLQPEITAISKAAPSSDSLVAAAINGIPKEASERGVFTEDVLRERFLKVENMARRLALVPEGGASLPIYLLSYLQSFLLVKAISPIPKAELANEPIDPDQLGTYDVLQRARYWLDRGDFKMTLRYMNLLKGAPRSVASEWMNETRILLETQQAVDALVAYAGASGLVLLGGGDTNKKQPVSTK